MEHPPELDPSEILADALALPPEERAAFLDRACDGRPALRAEVESLLASHAGSRRFFETPLVVPPQELDPASADPWTGRVIGPWRLAERIATGGMGAVYLAERVDREFEKKAALKLVRVGQDTEEVLARFRRERQVLANLEHPNISRLLDGGSTPEGLPYLVMEYVDGQPLDTYCDGRRLGIEERLELFLTVCDAVQYAHQNLVIHRDLKPGNILVDQAGTVKLLDFGIARLIGSGETDGDLTVTTSRRLTPRYASPEQITGGRVSTSTDVYSLGVVLYEMLCGCSPYPDMKSAFEMERAALQAVVPRPSQAVAPDHEAGAETSRRRGTTPRKLARRLAGDLDTIVLRALAKDPERRYPTVQAFAADIRRHLSGRPVLARPDTVTYRLTRFARRNRGLTAGIVAAFATLLMSLVLVSRAYRDSEESRREAEWLAYQNSLAAAESSIRSNQVVEAARRLATAPEPLRGWEWRHLTARLDRSRLHWPAHDGGITQMTWLDDGRLLTTSIDRTVRLWSGDGDLLVSHGPFDVPVESAALLPGSDRLVVGLADGAVLLVAGGRAQRLSGQGDGWTKVAVSPDGTRIAAGYYGGAVDVWETSTGRLVAGWRADHGLVIPSFGPDGSVLVTAGAPGRLRFWHPDGRLARDDLIGHNRRVYTLAWSPGGGQLALGSMDRTVSVWSFPGWQPLTSFREHQGTVTAIAFMDSAGKVISAGGDGRLLVWDAASGERTAELRGHGADVSAAAVAPDGKTIATGDWAGIVRLWDPAMDDVLTLRTLPARFLVPRVSDVRFDPSGRRLVAATNSTDCFQWDVAAKRSSTWALPGAIRAAYTVSGDSVVAVLSQGGIALLDAATGATLRSSQIRPDEGTVLAIDATGRLAATGGADSLVRIWSLPELATVATVEPGFPIRALAFLPDGSAILAGGDGGRLAALKAPGWTIEKTTEAGTGAIVGIAVHRDSRIFATCADDGEIRRWDRTQAEPGTLVFKNPDPTDCITLSPDGTRLAIGTWNTLVRIIDFSAAREVLALYGHTSRVSAVTWSPDGNLLVSAAHDGTVRVWDGGEGE